MAKKKLTHQEKPAPNRQQLEITRTMDDASLGKLQSLKSLNEILLKQTVELRQQVNSLKQSNGSLESELTRSNLEMEVLRSQLTQLDERVLELELERTVVVVFAGQLGGVIESERDEFKREKLEIEDKLEGLERKLQEVLRERDEKESAARAKIEAQLLELNEIRERLIEAEKMEKCTSLDLEKLKAEYASAMEKKEEMGRSIDSIMRDKDLLETSLMEYSKEFEEIKRKIETIGREKEEIKQERDVEVMRGMELENVVNGLNVTVSSLRNEEEKLHVYLAVLEDKCHESAEKGNEMQRHLDELVEVKNEMEERLKILIDEKELVNKDLKEAFNRLDEYKRKMEEMADEKSKISVDNVKKETEIMELEKQVVGLRNVISGMESACSDQQEKLKNLVSERDYYKDAFGRVTMENNEARKKLDEEKKNGVSLKEKIMEMEKNSDVNLELIEKMKEENHNFANKKEELESQCNELKEEITSRDKELVDARSELSAMRGQAELADSQSQLVLNALRSTAEFVNSKDEKDVPVGSYLDDEQMKGESVLYVEELEAIKSAFRSKEKEVKDMKRQIEFLENAVAAEHKKKSVLTIVSSATSVFAAISLAYLARGH